MLPCSRPGHLYSIDVESLNAGIPYADSFSVIIHYCMTSITENETCLAIFAQIKYKKNVWAIVRSKCQIELINNFKLKYFKCDNLDLYFLY